LEDTQSWCGIIMDGFHVHPSSVKVAHQAKAQGKMVLVTDAMPSVGAANKAFQLNGEWIQYDNGKLTTANGTLAGSDLNMLAAVKNAIEWAGIAPDEALRMASQHPAEMMGETQLGKIAVGYRASMILIDDDYQLLASWIDGEAEFWDVVTAS
jgi:N-acetylglucosamine-6-phosphate deacetylase